MKDTIIFILFIAIVIVVAKPSINNFNFGTVNNYYLENKSNLQNQITPKLAKPQKSKPAKANRRKGKKHR